jgi:CHAT domain-containing protein/predicted LPLAT superfamily acyltransferase
MRRIVNWFINLLNSRSKKIQTQMETLPITKEDIKTYGQFLQEVIIATAENNGDAQVIYPLLAANTDKLNYIFADLLRCWATNILAEAEPDGAAGIASLMVTFSNRIQRFPLGSKASNMEIAITGYDIALTVYTRSAFAEEWAITQNGLGNTYKDRILGERAENIEAAITAYTAALEVLTRSAFPVDWAMTQNNLGTAYGDRILGERADNIEMAIAAFTASLEVRTRSAFPVDWAMTQNNLALAYWERIKGDKAENIEKAITAFTAALEVRTRSIFPEQWAYTQNSLGEVYCKRILGERAENIEKAITAFTAVLEVRTRSAFPEQWAYTQNNLAAAYTERIKGDKAENIEKAITAFTAALEVRTRSAFPEYWAMTQNGLGNAYVNRILGERAEVKQAIACFTSALKVFTRSAFPEYWAMTQNNLALAYWERIKGDKAENIEKAITAYTAALEVRTRSAFPIDWAMTQNNLGTAYIERILGKRAENIEKAIAAFTATLEVYTRSAFPQQWGYTQNNLAAAYSDRILGERAENIEQAITRYTAALEVLTHSAFPQDWAMTQNNLGNAYYQRILGERAENIEQAITAFNAALKEVYTCRVFPQQWAMTQNNLGNAYKDRILGERAENLEKAIAAYSAALEVRTRSALPQDWAYTQNNLATAYYQRILGKRTENIEEAIARYNTALEVFTHSAFPEYWAMTQNNLGSAYKDRILGERAENIEKAITAYTSALEVRTRSAFPQNNAETLLNLGIVYQQEKQFNSAYNTFVKAIETVETLRGEIRDQIVSGEEAKRKQAEEWNQLYRCMVKVCIQLGNITTAIEYVERSKTRNLVESIFNRDLKTIFPPEDGNRLQQLQNGKAENPTDLAQRLQQLRQKRQELQDQCLPVGAGFKFEEFQANLGKSIAIIEWYITSDQIIVFIIKPQGQKITVVSQSQSEDGEAFYHCIKEYLNDYYTQKDKWQNQLEKWLKKLSEILHLEEILTHIPQNCTRLILIPHRYLHLFPLHAFPLSNGELLYERFPDGVGYAPSCQILQQVQLRQRPNFKSLFAIQNPIEDLDYADLEVESILKIFPTPQVLAHKQATKDKLFEKLPSIQKANYLHFSCHGLFNFNSPQDSCLLLAESTDEQNNLDLSKCLTLGNLFERDFQLDNCRLVVLSACETGLVDFTNTSDEYISLPSGFFYAGATNVVSSLWTVDDLSTSFLMIKFLQNFQNGIANNKNSSIALALNQAQSWIKNATKEELGAWVSNLPLDSTWKMHINQYLAGLEPGSKPFESPYHWAGFIAVGK